MSAKSPSLSVACEELRGPLEGLAAANAEFDEFFTSMREELKTLAGELVRRQQSWQAEQAEQEAELERRAARLQDERSEVASRWEEVQTLAEQNRSDSAGAAEANGGQIDQLLEESRHERTALQNALEVTQAQAAQLAQVVSELSQTRTELTEVRQEIKDYPEQLEAARAEDAKSPQLATLEDKLHRFEQEQAESNQERAVLETELESVRNRAAELSDEIVQERQRISEERTEWTAELKRMRKILEALSQRETGSDEAGVGGDPRRSSGTEQDNSSQTAKDPVLDSVMAQFEILQKDLAKRRKGGAKTNA